MHLLLNMYIPIPPPLVVTKQTTCLNMPQNGSLARRRYKIYRASTPILITYTIKKILTYEIKNVFFYLLGFFNTLR